jgi:beta-lactamase regulating signal transducer with metallopeptidase domain
MTFWLAANMAWASAAMVLALLLRRPFARLFGAGSAYALWLVPALRLVMPPLPAFAPDLPSLVPPQTLILFVGDAAAPLPPDGGSGQWVPILLALWAGGAVLFLGWQWLAYRRFLAELRLTQRTIGAHRGLPLVESAAVEGPVALGLIDRRIVVPADFATRYSAGEQSLALDHEAIHHRRGDLWWNHVGLVILALNWFNPVAWLAFRAFRADQELACDALVTAAATPEARHDYARALIKSASRPGLIAACPLNHADQLKRRLKMMKTHKSSRARMLGGGAAILTLAGVTLALGSPGFAQPQPAAPPAPSAQTRTETRTDTNTQSWTQSDDSGHQQRIIIRTERSGDDANAAEHREHMEHMSDGGGHSERVIVMTRHGDGAEGHADHGAMPHIEMHGPHGDVTVPNCDQGQRDEINEGTDGNQTRIVLCSRGGEATPAQRAERLQHVRDRLADESELSAEQRARVLAAIDAQIARLRAQ